MGVIRATATIELEGGALQDVEIILLCDPTSYRFDDSGEGSPCDLYVFTDPSSYVSGIAVIASDPYARITGGTVIDYAVENEEVTLSSQADGENAIGKVDYPIEKSFVAVNYGGIGGTDYVIQAQKIGTRNIRTRGTARLVQGKVTYKAKARKFTVRGQRQPKVDLEVTLTY